MKSELSKKNEYWLPKHRYYELKHFCLQYPFWKSQCNSIDSVPQKSITTILSGANYSNSPIEKAVQLRELYLKNIAEVEQAAYLTDKVIAPYLIMGVTTNQSYDILVTKHSMPCSRSTYYRLYRKFFYILNYSHNFHLL